MDFLRLNGQENGIPLPVIRAIANANDHFLILRHALRFQVQVRFVVENLLKFHNGGNAHIADKKVLPADAEDALMRFPIPVSGEYLRIFFSSKVIFAPSRNTTVHCPAAAVRETGNRFICGVPINPATKVFSG